jgi:mRNA interferase HigB
MVVISKTILNEFSEKHPGARAPLNKWYNEIKAANWSNFGDLKNTFNATDSVGNDRYVFDIKGNRYRLIAMIIFRTRTVFILFIGTHSEYDRIDATQINYTK